MTNLSVQPILGRLVLPVGVSMGIAGLVIRSDSRPREFLLSVLAVVVPLPIIIRIFQRKFDPFEPIFLLAIAFLVVFLVRPIAHLAYGEMTYGDLSLEPGFDGALIVAIAGIVASYAGYAMGVGRSMAHRFKPLATAVAPEGTIMVAGGLLVVGLVLYGLYIEQVGGLAVAKRFFRGRDPFEGYAISQTTAYFRFGPFLAIPATLLLLEAAAAKRRALFVLLSALSTGLVVLLVTGPRGDRLWLMLLIMPVLVLSYLRKERRPAVRTLVVIGVACFAFGITFLSDVRVPVARTASPYELLKASAQHPFRGWHDFILGADTEMFSILALETERVPATQPYEPGLTVVNLATTWIPRRLYSGKPEGGDFKVYSMLFPDQARATKAGTSPSIFGVFYYDSGLVGVAIGGLLFGVLARMLFEYLLAYPTSAGVRLLYAATLPFIVITVRGSPTDTIGRMAYIVFPIVVAVWWAGRREPRGAHRHFTAPARQ